MAQPLCAAVLFSRASVRYIVTAAELSVISQTETLSQSKTPKVTLSLTQRLEGEPQAVVGRCYRERNKSVYLLIARRIRRAIRRASH
jgi:hypothetical protein